MNHHEREFFIASIRSGKLKIKSKNITLYVIPPTFDILADSCEIYEESFNESYVDGIMNEEDNLEWMIKNGLWSYDDDAKIKIINQDIEKLKVEIYNNRKDAKLASKIRSYIRVAEKNINELNAKKNMYFSNTCEGIAVSEKTSFIIKQCTYCNNELYDFSDLSLSYVIEEYHKSFLSESQCRLLSRSEPWKSLWIIKDHANIKLFNNPDNTDLTYNQKNLLIWSQMYDNIQESLDCPTKEVIEDDDMLDGWFIIQSKKREKEKSEREFEEQTKSDKIKNSSEVFVMAQDQSQVEKVSNMNDFGGNMIKKQRFDLIKKKGTVGQHEFQDEKLKMRAQATQGFRNQIKGGRR
jgi:hypothetical protein